MSLDPVNAVHELGSSVRPLKVMPNDLILKHSWSST